ncbi:MAG: hypothetical protein WBC97_04955 [Gemmatimonadales bacterium]
MFERYAEFVMGYAKREFWPYFQAHRKEFDEVMRNHLFQKDGPKILNDSDPADRSATVLRAVFYGFMEIRASLDALKDIAVYIASFHYDGSRITRTRYLSYHIENYWGEVYLLRERLLSYATTIARLRKGRSGGRAAVAAAGRAKQAVEIDLKPVLDERGSHVHVRRYTSEDLKRLMTWEMLAAESPEARPVFESELNATTLNYQRLVEFGNQRISKLVNGYFEQIGPYIFDEDGIMNVPI